MSALRRALVFASVAAALALPVLVRPATARAHPLSNFTVNHYTRITVGESGIELFRVLDLAEIPAFQERRTIDADGDGEVSAAESEAWSASRADDLATNMELLAGGETLALGAVARDLTFPEGEGRLVTLRLEVTYVAPLPEGVGTAALVVGFKDSNDLDRVGWREVVVANGAGVRVGDVAGALQRDVSRELTQFPEDSLSSPLDQRSARFSATAAPGAPAAPSLSREDRAVRGNSDSSLGRYSELVEQDNLTIGVALAALLAAVGFGALHALSPGHGKTVVAAYVVGSRGTALHALLLGLTVTATHTSSVYAIGFATLYLSEYIVPEDLYPWMSVASGVLIVAMGLSLFAGRLRSSGLLADATAWFHRRATRLFLGRRAELVLASESGALLVGARHQRGSTRDEPTADHAAHSHGTGHAHAHKESAEPNEERSHCHGWGSHAHAIPGQDGAPVTWRGLVGLGIFGGLLPCPSAIVVMLSAISLHRVGFGLLLIVAFSLGLAAVLTGIGFALVYARAISRRVSIVQRLAERGQASTGAMGLALRGFPVAGAAAVSVAGSVILLRALGSL